jgi:hypothetical protein
VKDGEGKHISIVGTMYPIVTASGRTPSSFEASATILSARAIFDAGCSSTREVQKKVAKYTGMTMPHGTN